MREIKFSDYRKKNIMNKVNEKNKKSKRIGIKTVALVGILLILGTTTVLGASQIFNSMKVNKKELPSMDPVQIVKVDTSNLEKKDDMYETKMTSYSSLQKVLNIKLLNPGKEEQIKNQQIEVYGDDDWIQIKVQNYIQGDTKNISWNNEEHIMEYEHGEEFYSPINLELQLVLTDEQAQRGLNDEYLGYYQYETDYISAQGYKVNILCTTGETNSPEYAKRIAVFVAGGIQYKLSGQVSTATMKKVIDSME